MSRNYDNWERLVSAVIRREQYRQLCYAPSLSSGSSTSSFSHNPSLDFANPQRRDLLPFGISAGLTGFHNFNREIRRLTLEPLVFVGDSPFGFGVQILLTAPSRNLGEEMGTFNQSYLLSLGFNFLVVARRMQGVGILSRNLEENMKMIGSVNHENLVNLRGYYSVRDTMVFGIYDYFSQGSLSTILYGKREQNDAESEWDARIRIAVGAARGLAHIHKQCNGKLVHGNLKASNILINSEGYGCVADFCLKNFMNPSEPKVTTIRGYMPPELLVQGLMVSQASDVYSFGVILIELLGGKSPEHVIHSRYSDWARYKARDDWRVLVFDTRLLKVTRVKEEMHDMLILALSCMAEDPGDRMSIEGVVNILESMIH